VIPPNENTRFDHTSPPHSLSCSFLMQPCACSCLPNPLGKSHEGAEADMKKLAKVAQTKYGINGSSRALSSIG
jgi:hypothetical protein